MTPGETVSEQPEPIEESEGSTRLAVFRHWARRITLASIFANALLGVWAMAGPLHDFEAAALSTSLLITGAGVTSVACAAAIPERRIGLIVPLVGIGAAILGFFLLIGAVWNDFRIQTLWRLGGSLVAIGVAVAFASLLSDVHLKGRYRRLLWAAYILVTVAAVFVVAVLWGWVPGDSWRLFGIVAVLLGAVTTAAPVVERLRPESGGSPDIRHCPYCGADAKARGEKARCTSCRRRFRVLES